MLGSLTKTGVRTVGWFGLAYLGYWTAVFLDDILVRLSVYPLLGAPVLDWRLTPFRAIVNNGDLRTILVPGTARSLLPFLPAFLAVTLVAAFGQRLRSVLLRVWAHHAGLWLVILLTGQLAFLAYLGRGRFASLLSFLAKNPQAMSVRVACVVIGMAVLLWVGALYADRLLTDELGFLSAGTRPGWRHLLLFVAPFPLILSGIFGFPFRFLGTRAVLLLLIPSAFCLLLGSVALYRTRREATRSGPSAIAAPGSLSLQKSVAVALFAALLYVGLASADRAEALLLEQRLASYTSPHYEIRYDSRSFTPEFIRNFAAERERILEHLTSRLQFADDQFSPADPIRLRVVLYSDFPTKRTATQSDRPYNVQGMTIRALLHGYLQRLDPAADAAAMLNAAWGASSSPLVAEWVARLLAGNWRGATIEHWAARIENDAGHYTLEELVQTDASANMSPLVRAPLGAAWVRRVYDQRGLAGVRLLYSRTPPPHNLSSVAGLLGISPSELERDWSEWTQQLRAQGGPSVPRGGLGTGTGPAPGSARADNFFFRGMSFSHEGWGGRRGGYTGPEAAEQLGRLKELGANAIAVVPYGFMRDPDAPAISYASTDESDEELTQALHLAHGLGIKVMLKPQLWVSRGVFTGQIRFDEPEQRAQWMRAYREFILHYAWLAELEGFDLLCIGNELEGMTVYEDDWRRLIADVRRVYHGPITYAANWGHEFESLRFWDALDYAGLNNYYPLASRTRRDGDATSRRQEIFHGAQRIALRLNAFHHQCKRPILLTEVGYPSARGAAAEPWIEDGRRGVDLEEQAQSYEAVFQAFASRAWLRGMFWWKWPSHGRGGGPGDASFTPLGKPAADVLRAWYTRMANGEGQPARSPAGNGP